MNEGFRIAPTYLRGLNSIGIQRELAAVTISTYVDGDGRATYLYHYGSTAAPTLILLPPTGMSFLLISRLALVLSNEFHVLSWESRGCPNTDVPMADHDTEMETQAAEFAGIVASEGIGEFHFVGWCQAAQKAVLACQSTSTLKPLSLSLIAPAGLGYSVVSSDFERCVLPVYLQMAARDVTYAGRMSEILDISARQSNQQGQLPERLSLFHLSSPETTFRFARYMKTFTDSKPFIKPLVHGILERVRTQLIHCRDDTFSHYSESVQLARAHTSARLELFRSGGHLFMFKQADVVAAVIRGFVAEVTRQQGARPVPAADESLAGTPLPGQGHQGEPAER
jgi:pimeloyl-ACP methyl ester carboxylesterase